MRNVAIVCLLLVALALLLIVSAPTVSAAAQAAFSVNFFGTVVDEQTKVGCSNPPLIATPYATGDVTADPAAVGPTSAYTTAPWPAPFTVLSSVAFKNAADCNPSSGNCLAVGLNHNQTVISVDSRLSRDPTTGKTRAIRLDFSQPCFNCAYGPGPANPFGTNPYAAPGLLSVFLTVPYTGMPVCSTTDCPEAETGTARFWFNDASGTSWRVDWGLVRVLRVSSSTWYVLADGCDGSQVATLYRLAKKGSNASRVGQYLMPFFVTAGQ